MAGARTCEPVDEAGFFQKSQEAFEVGEESLQNTFTKSLWAS